MNRMAANPKDTKMILDMLDSPVPQTLNEDGTYSVLANGDVSGINFRRTKLLRDHIGNVLPQQYFDVDKGRFVPGTIGGGGDVSKADLLNLSSEVNGKVDQVAQQLAQKAAKSEVENLVVNKAEKTYVDTLAASLASGSPKGTYTTVAALETAFPTGNTNIYVVTADGKWYYWSGSVWTPGGIYQATGLADKTVTPKTTSFIKVSTNLLDVKTFTKGFNVDLTTGEPIASGVSFLTSFIAIDSTKTYTSKDLNRRAYYDANKVFISAFSGNATWAALPANARYVRVSSTSPTTSQINEGNVLLPFENYYEPYFVGVEVVELKDGSVTKDKIPLNEIGVDQLDFIESSNNLIDSRKLEIGFSLSSTTGEPVANSTGVISEFIQAKPLQDYTGSITRYALYDKDRAFISGGTTTTFKTTFNTAYIRVVFYKPNVGVAQLNEGTSLLPYEEFYRKFTDDSLIKVVNKGTALGNRKYYIEDFDINKVYTAPTMQNMSATSSTPMSGVTLNNLYGFYDELVANYPEYVSKTFLGNDITGLPIYRYDFKPKITENNSVSTNFPKMLVVSGTHGFERTSIWVTLQAMKQICVNWKDDEPLEVLRWNIHFIVIPVLTPWSYNNATRKNSRGVDISRNFPSGWETASSDPSSSTYRGESPLSELEAQYINAILENEKDILYTVDFHNFHTPINDLGQPMPEKFLWIPGASNLTIAAGKYLISKMSRKWKKEYPFLSQDDTTIFGYADNALPGGTIGVHAVAKGHHSNTFEICQRFELEPGYENYSALVIQLGTESFINWLLLMLKHCVMDYNSKV